jgi:hypothetical protein
MPEIVNPYIAGSPVTGTEMFFGREDVFAFIRHALIGQHRDNVIVLYGQRRTGKTSVLYQMNRRLDARYVCIFLDMHGLALDGLGNLLWELANHITRILRRDYQVDLPRLERAAFALDPRTSFENEFLSQVWTAIGDRHLLLMLDEAIRIQEQVRAGKLEPEIFGYLRHLMQHHERLNFLVALGSGLEEMAKEYAFLFSVGLYKKISFLEPEQAIALITQPARDYYTVAPAAVERILQITSGHPYYTQLLCHSLFNRWQQRPVPQIQVADVDASLDEVVERGLAVLKHVWEEATAGEKAILAAMAATMGERNTPVTVREIGRAWANVGVAIPAGEIATAIKGLITRDVITGHDAFVFAVDLQRLWVRKYERLAWVKEEIAAATQGWQHPRSARASGRRPWLLLGGTLAMVLVIVLLVGAVSRWFPRPTPLAAGAATGAKVILAGDAAKISDLVVFSNSVWAATDGGVVRWNMDGTPRAVDGSDLGFPSNCATTIVTAPDRTLWAGCGGVAHFRPAGEQVVSLGFFNRDDGLGMGAVRTLMVDTDGTIWAGGARAPDRPPPLSHFDAHSHPDGKAWRTDEPLLEALAKQEGVELTISSLLRSRDGALWVGLKADGVLRWDGKAWMHFGPPAGIGGSGGGDFRVRRLLQDRSGTIWAAASDAGLRRFDPGRQRWVQISPIDDALPITTIAEFADHSLWAAGNRRVARSTDDGQHWAQMGTDGDGLGADIGALVEDGGGRVWAGAYQGGISVFDGAHWRPLQQ